MSERNIPQAVRSFVAQVSGKPFEEIDGETSLDTLNLDSLDRVSLAGDLEQSFDIDLGDEAPHKWATVKDVLNSVQQRIDAQKGMTA